MASRQRTCLALNAEIISLQRQLQRHQVTHTLLAERGRQHLYQALEKRQRKLIDLLGRTQPYCQP